MQFFFSSRGRSKSMTSIISRAANKSSGAPAPVKEEGLAAVREPAVPLSGRDIICFAGEDWWYHNPHSNLHLMKAFAKQNRIIFVNSIGVRAPNLRKDKFAGKRILGKLKSLLRYFKKAEENIWVLTPLAIPLFKGKEEQISKINKTLLTCQVKFAAGLIKFQRPVLWVCVPTVQPAAAELQKAYARCVVYYCCDNISYLEGVKNEFVAGLEETLHRSADVAFFANESLAAERRAVNPNTHYLPHGTDYEHFERAQGTGLKIPEDMILINRPVVGYMGSLRGLDFELVRYLAERNPGLSFVFIGDILSDVEPLKAVPNIHFLGKKPYGELPAYLAAMDCLTIFYKRGETFNDYRNPKKLLEYFATGKPVVAMAIKELEQYKKFMSLAASYEEFEKLMLKALAGEDAGTRNERVRFARNLTWDHAAAGAGARINQAIGKREAQ